MHGTKKTFVYLTVIFLIVAGLAQALQLSTWLPFSAGAGFEGVAKKVQTAALYAFVPLSVAGLVAACCLGHKHKGEYAETGAAESSGPLLG